MKRFRRIWVVYRKELIETLRDRRTLIAMVFVPIVLYPLLMLVLVEALRTESGRRRAETYTICVPIDDHKAWLAGVLQREDQARERWERAAEGDVAADDSEAPDALNLAGDAGRSLGADQFEIEVVGPDASLWQRVREGRNHVGLIVEPPPDPQHPFDMHNRVVQFIYAESNLRSEFAFNQLQNIISHEADRIVAARMANVPGGRDVLTPIYMQGLSTASPEQQYAKILAMVVPFLLVIMTVTGAIYPAIDLTAGERERGTLETLAVSPVPVGQIVAGKFGVIVTIAMVTTALNLGSMTAMVHFTRLHQIATAQRDDDSPVAATVRQMIDQTATQPSELAFHQQNYLEQRAAVEQQAASNTTFVIIAAPIVLLAMVPFAVLFSGVMLAACSFARTFKEAQNYMMPVMMAAMIPAMVVSYMPTLRLEGALLVVPVANIVILIRDLFLGQYDVPAMAVCFLSTCLYAAAAVAVAARLYGNEAVLFSDVGSYKTLIRRRFIKPSVLPSPAVALMAVALIFPVYFYWQSYLVDLDSSPERFRTVLIVGQVLLFAATTFAICWYLKIDLRETFSLYAPRPLPLLGSLLIAAAIVPLSNLLVQIQHYLLPGLRPAEELLYQEQAFFAEGAPWELIVALAVVPAVCEELLFRGFLLGGLRRHLTVGRLALVVGLIFGVFHIHVEKIPIITVIGMVLAFVCVWSRSIFPAMLVHFANNGLGVLAAREENERLRNWLGLRDLPVEEIGQSVQFDMQTAIYLAVCVVGFAILYAGRERRAQAASSA